MGHLGEPDNLHVPVHVDALYHVARGARAGDRGGDDDGAQPDAPSRLQHPRQPVRQPAQPDGHRPGVQLCPLIRHPGTLFSTVARFAFVWFTLLSNFSYQFYFWDICVNYLLEGFTKKELNEKV